MENNTITISKKTLVPISFVLVIVGVVVYISKIEGRTLENKKNTDFIASTYVTKEVLDLKLAPISSDLAAIKNALNVK